MPTVHCKECGVAFHVPPSRSKSARFCSITCSAAHQRIGTITRDGYRRLAFSYKKFVEHRFVMEQHLRRELLPSEVVHHKDGDKLNNRLENLVVLDSSEHNRHHNPLTWDLKAALALRTEGVPFWEIEKRLNVRHHIVPAAFGRRGLHVPDPHWSKPLTWDLERAKALRAQGLSFEKIGNAVGVTGNAVRRAFVRRGL